MSWNPDTGFDSLSDWLHANNDAHYEERRELAGLAMKRAEEIAATQYPASIEKEMADEPKELRRLEPFLKEGYERMKRTGGSGRATGNVYAIIRTIQLNILSSAIINDELSEEEIRCAGEDNEGNAQLPCFYPGTAAGTVGMQTLGESEIPSKPSDPGYENLRTRILQLIHEVQWLTAYGGYRGIIPAGAAKAFGPENDPTFRSFAWVFNRFAAKRYELTRFGLREAFAKRDSRKLIALMEDVLDFLRTRDMPRLNDLRFVTFPGVEIYRRTYWGPGPAAERPVAAIDAVEMYQGANQVEVMPVREARPIAHRVRDAFKGAIGMTVRARNAENPENPVSESAIRFMPTGWLRWNATGSMAVNWAIYLVFNTEPAAFTMPNSPLPAVMTRLAASAMSMNQGWAISHGRQWIDIVADNLRVSFVEVPDFPNVGPQMLFQTGPSSYTEAMQRAAVSRGYFLDAFGLYRPTNLNPTKPELHVVRSTVSEPNFDRIDWWEQGERLIYDALGLRYQTPRERFDGVMPEPN